MCHEVPKFGKENFKINKEICQTEVQKTQCCLKVTPMTFENEMPINSAAIWPECIVSQLYHPEHSKQQRRVAKS